MKKWKKILTAFFFLHGFFFLLLFFAVLLLASVDNGKRQIPYNSGMAVSNGVRQYEQTVYEEAVQEGIEEYVRCLLAIMQVETGGNGRDVMQSLGNSGLEEDEKTPELSIKRAVQYFADLIRRAGEKGCDMDTVIQAYNYGAGYIGYVSENGGKHSYTLASMFACEKAGGNKVTYQNQIAVKTNGGWRYAYGNMFYVYLVRQYLAVDPMSEETANAILSEAVKYKGWQYVWGGSNPQTSFDCSGLVQWCYGTAGITVPRTAQQQYNAMEHITLEEAAPGDLLFFTRTTDSGNYITHVGIYAGDNKMFHAGNPLGYADVTTTYWQKHFVCAGRLK